MAEASIVVTVQKIFILPGEGQIVSGSLAVDASADTYADGGLALGATEFANKVPLAQGVKPLALFATGIAGFVYEYDQANGRLFIRAQTNAASEDAPLGELTVAAIPAAVSGDTITFVAFFEKFPSA